MISGGTRFFASFEDLHRAEPGAVAVVDASRGEVLDRDDLMRLVDRAARTVVDARTRMAGGSLLPLFVPTSADLVASVLACWREGVAPSLVDAEAALEEARAIASQLGAERLLVAGGASGPEWIDTTSQITPPAPAPLPTGTAVLKLTSGTSGEAKAVAVTEDALAAGVAQIASTMGIGPGDRNLVPVPLTHSYGFDSALVLLAVLGCPAVLARGLPPAQLFAAGRAAEATVLLAVPVLLDVLSRATSAMGTRWPALRLVVSAGAPLGAATRERFAGRFDVRPRNFYGSTECGGITFDREGLAELAEGCVGAPLDGVRLELDGAGARVDATAAAPAAARAAAAVARAARADGDEGELEEGIGRVRVVSPSAAAGYFPLAPGASPGGLDRPGSFLTADLGRIDAEGRLHLLGRVDDAVNVGGRKVFPAEVERVIRSLPGVREATVLGVERVAGAAALHAIVVADASVDRATVIRACEERLARHKIPRVVEFRDELPRTERGKLDRRRLAAEHVAR